MVFSSAVFFACQDRAGGDAKGSNSLMSDSAKICVGPWRVAAVANRERRTQVQSVCFAGRFSPHKKPGPRANRIAPQCSALSVTSTLRLVIRRRPSRRMAAATSRTCGISARHAASSACSARATSDGQMDEVAARRDSWRVISSAMASSIGWSERFMTIAE